jgi:hypothetical protein
MGSRGRTSIASLGIASTIEAVARPDAPYDLTDEQADEWRSVVNRLPADWFPRETWPMLSQYCRHVVQSRRVAQLVEQAQSAEEFDLKQYDTLLKMAERESRCIASLATRMRITQQSSYDKSKKKGSGGIKKPWES